MVVQVLVGSMEPSLFFLGDKSLISLLSSDLINQKPASAPTLQSSFQPEKQGKEIRM